MSAWTQLTEPGPALLILVLVLTPQLEAAPFGNSDQSQEIEYYPVADATGCYYNFEHYDAGDRIITNEPCLNCTCHNRMLMCYLRVCPFTKAIGQDCTVEKKPDQCCPVITCPEVPVQLVPQASTTPSTHVGHPNEYGCSIDSLFYADGAKVPSNPNNPCEVCYCIRNKTACIIQECTLTGEVVEGCRPVYVDGVCCPVRYDCDHPELETTPRPLLTTTTTTLPPTATPNDCIYNNEVYADGALVKKDVPCEQCYCMRGDIVCAVQECGPTPLEKVNCTALPTKEGQCCPDTYECDHISEEDLTTLSSTYEIPTTQSTNTEGFPDLAEEESIPTIKIPTGQLAVETEEQVTEPVENQTISEEGPVTESATIETFTSRITEAVEAVTFKVTEIVEAITSSITSSETSSILSSKEDATTEPEIISEGPGQEYETSTVAGQSILIDSSEQVTELAVTKQQPVTVSEVTTQPNASTEETTEEKESSTPENLPVTDKIEAVTEQAADKNQQSVTSQTDETKQEPETSTIPEKSAITDKAEEATQKAVEQQTVSPDEVTSLPEILIGKTTESAPEQPTATDKIEQITEKIEEQQTITISGTEVYTEETSEAITESYIHETKTPVADDQKLVTALETNVPVTTEGVSQAEEEVPLEQDNVTGISEPVVHDDHEESEHEELPHEDENELVEGSGKQPQEEEQSVTETPLSETVDEHKPSIVQVATEKESQSTEEPEVETTSLVTEQQSHNEIEGFGETQQTPEIGSTVTPESKIEQIPVGATDQGEIQTTQLPLLESSVGAGADTETTGESVQTTENISVVQSEVGGLNEDVTESSITVATSDGSITTSPEVSRTTEPPQEYITEEIIVPEQCTKEGCYPTIPVTDGETLQPDEPEKSAGHTELGSPVTPEVEEFLTQGPETELPVNEVTSTENIVASKPEEPITSEEEKKETQPEAETPTTVSYIQEPNIIKEPPTEEKEHKEEEVVEKTSVTETVPITETKKEEALEDQYTTTEKQEEEIQIVTEIPTKESEKPQSMDHVSETVSSLSPPQLESDTDVSEVLKEKEIIDKDVVATEVPKHEIEQADVTKTEGISTKLPEVEDTPTESITEIATSASGVPELSPTCIGEHGCAPEQGEDNKVPGIVEDCTAESCIPHEVVIEKEGSTERNIPGAPTSSEDSERPACDTEKGCIPDSGKEVEAVTEISQVVEVSNIPEKEGEKGIPDDSAATEAGEIHKTSEVTATEITTDIVHETQQPEHESPEQPTLSETSTTLPRETETEIPEVTQSSKESEEQSVSGQEETVEGTKSPILSTKEKPEQGTEQTVISEDKIEEETVQPTPVPTEGQVDLSTEAQDSSKLENEIIPESTTPQENLLEETEPIQTTSTVGQVPEVTTSSEIPVENKIPEIVPDSQKPEHEVENEIIPQATEIPEVTQSSKESETESPETVGGILSEGTEATEIKNTQVPEVIIPEETGVPVYTSEDTRAPEEVTPTEISQYTVPEGAQLPVDESKTSLPSGLSTEATQSPSLIQVTEEPEDTSTTQQTLFDSSSQGVSQVTTLPENVDSITTEGSVIPQAPEGTDIESTEISDISIETTTVREQVISETTPEEFAPKGTKPPKTESTGDTQTLQDVISTEPPERVSPEQFEHTTISVQASPESTEASGIGSTVHEEPLPGITATATTSPEEGEFIGSTETTDQTIEKVTQAAKQEIPETTQFPEISPEISSESQGQTVSEGTYDFEHTGTVPEAPTVSEHITETGQTVQGSEESITESATTAIPSEAEEHGIPGEGNCLVDGKTYKNNSNVPPINQCQTLCKCVSSILQCESVSCSPPPSNLQDCMPIFHSPDSCCPVYSCSVPGGTNLVSDSHVVETTPTQDEEKFVETTGTPAISSESGATEVTEKQFSEQTTTKRIEETYVTIKSDSSTEIPQELFTVGSISELPHLPIDKNQTVEPYLPEYITTQGVPETESDTEISVTEPAKETLLPESQTITSSSESSISTEAGEAVVTEKAVEAGEEEQHPEQDEVEHETPEEPIISEHCDAAGCVPVVITGEQDKIENEIPEESLVPEYPVTEISTEEQREPEEQNVIVQSQEKDELPISVTEVTEQVVTKEYTTPVHIIQTDESHEEEKQSPSVVTSQPPAELPASTETESDEVVSETTTENVQGQQLTEEEQTAAESGAPVKEPEFSTENAIKETLETEKPSELTTEVATDETSKTPEEMAAIPEIEEAATLASVLPEFATESVITEEAITEEDSILKGEQSSSTTENQPTTANTEQSIESDNEVTGKPEVIEVQKPENKPEAEDSLTDQQTPVLTNEPTTESQQSLETTSPIIVYVTESEEFVPKKPETADHVSEEGIISSTETSPELITTQSVTEDEIKTETESQKESLPSKESETTTVSSAETTRPADLLPAVTKLSTDQDETTEIGITEYEESTVEQGTVASIEGTPTEVTPIDIGEKLPEKGITTPSESELPVKPTTVSVEKDETTKVSIIEHAEKEVQTDVTVSVGETEPTELSVTESAENEPEKGVTETAQQETVTEINLTEFEEKETEKATATTVEKGLTTEANVESESEKGTTVTEVNLIEPEEIKSEESTSSSVEQEKNTEVNTLQPGEKEKLVTPSVAQGEVTEVTSEEIQTERVTPTFVEQTEEEVTPIESVDKQPEKGGTVVPVTDGLLTPEKEQEVVTEKEQEVVTEKEQEVVTEKDQTAESPEAPIEKETEQQTTQTEIKDITTEPQLEASSEVSFSSKPSVETLKPLTAAEEVYTSPQITTQSPSTLSELYTSGPSQEVSTKKAVKGELSTSAPVTPIPHVETLTSGQTHAPDLIPGHSIPGEQTPELPDYHPLVDDYEEEDQSPAGPGTCRYGGKVYVSAQQIPRDDPCDFCFCFRSDIICLQQSCPPPIPRCHEEPIRGFCCPRYECPVSMALAVNVTTSTTTTTTTLPPHFLSHAYKDRVKKTGCQIRGKAYQVGDDIKSASGPCLHCTCGGDGEMKCDPKPCSPEPMLRQMIAAAASRRRR